MNNFPSSVNLPHFAPVDKVNPSDPTTKRRECSFEIAAKGSKAAVTSPVQSSPVLPVPSQLPLLPRTKRSSFSSHRHDANPALAIKVLEDIQAAVVGWHQALRQVLQDIQAIYLEGPMVEGWLEMVQNGDPNPGVDAAILRHADPQELAGYLEQICAKAEGSDRNLPPLNSESQYHLCNLDADGQMQCQICPPEQLPFVSLAIARHQKLRQHLNQKQYLEARLKRAVEVLSQAREDLGIAPSGQRTE